MEIVNKKEQGYIHIKDDQANVLFFTAEDGLDFSISKDEGLKNLAEVKERFNLSELGYSYQIHSNTVKVYDGVISEGDSMVTDEKKLGLGIFTADCVPVMLYDRKKKVIGAVHSGWKGTYAEVCKNTIEKMRTSYQSEAGDISIYIGPHIRECCYEVSRELAEKFSEKFKHVFDEKKQYKISLEDYIIQQCLKSGISRDNIISVKQCTYCSKEYEFHSYRKNNTAGRMLSLIFMKS